MKNSRGVLPRMKFQVRLKRKVKKQLKEFNGFFSTNKLCRFTEQRLNRLKFLPFTGKVIASIFQYNQHLFLTIHQKFDKCSDFIVVIKTRQKIMYLSYVNPQENNLILH